LLRVALGKPSVDYQLRGRKNQESINLISKLHSENRGATGEPHGNKKNGARYPTSKSSLGKHSFGRNRIVSEGKEGD